MCPQGPSFHVPRPQPAKRSESEKGFGDENGQYQERVLCPSPLESLPFKTKKCLKKVGLSHVLTKRKAGSEYEIELRKE